MDIKDLKSLIESKNLYDGLLVFVTGKSEQSVFICNQYLNEIISIKHDVVNVKSIDELIAIKSDILFGGWDDFVVCKLDSFDVCKDIIRTFTNCIIVCKDISPKCKDFFNDCIIEFPKLEEWQIEDYIKSFCKGLSEKSSKYLAKLCNYNIFRASNEADKISLFNENSQELVLSELCRENFTDDINNYEMFNLSNAIVSHNFSELRSIWRNADMFDSDPMWLLSILISHYKTIIDVFLYPNSTPEICGISVKRFNAIKYYNRNYTKKQLVDIYTFLTDVDRALKTGELSDVNLRDFIIINVIQKGTQK